MSKNKYTSGQRTFAVRYGAGPLFALLFACAPHISFAANASFYLSPDTGVYTIGEEFPVDIVIDTDGETITAAGGGVTFNREQLEVVSIDTTGSIVTSWIPSGGPEYSNETGNISFEGFIAGGYLGDDGKIAEVVFRALSNVTSKVRFQGGSAILAADDKATNILTQMNSGAYTLNPDEVEPNLEYVAVANTEVSDVTSATHPDQNSWYTATTSEFTWSVTDDIESVRILFDEKPTTIPTRFYDEPISERTIEDIEEGVWYFHLQTRNEAGWGDVTHFRIQVDVTDPEYFTVTPVERDALTDPSPKFVFDAFDALSGIVGYEVSLDGGVGQIVSADASSTETLYQVQKAAAGEHELTIRAIDAAGNFLEESVSFSVEAIPAPTITEYQEKVTLGGVIAVKGMALPDSEVKVYVSKDGAEPTEDRILTGADGSFTYVMGEAKEEGEFVVQAKTKNMYGAESVLSGAVRIIVSKPGFVVYGGVILGYLSVIVPLVALAVLLFVVLWFGWYKFRVYKQRIRKEVDEAEDALHDGFAALRKITEREVASLERARSHRKLTPEEESIIRKLKGEVADTEEAVEKEFADIKNVAVQKVGDEVHHEHHDPVVDEEAVHHTEHTAPKRPQNNKMQIRIEKLH